MQAQQLAQWQRLANTLGQKALVKLDKAKVEYRVPLAGAKIQDGLMHMNTSFPGLALEYREMNGQWQRWSHGVKVTLPVAVRARSADDKRAGRMLILRDSS
ncbi:chitobiase/beta-hexosaminidase C-terminal domain-containing protein [Shewanella sp. SNU WT4]|uniref:chitobiase/beta-hexosaminidase C-terminal domain-containing protein n=1 Tax=Shewanella sp. SNU WT4 TaxID=2590015 RepID=UPI003211D44E